ncbi:hypothetical protein LshimejAT787_1502270 [Lyophyllum shimeji]|uniref:DUF6532 domain-containing protein n=1 Tax=Lyophyllum shimeji TaxID=47721 RepID=A0A9P3PYT1_LYOSH|nr:hypothetical protein LshimejAT787_1502270 [Lyophyllum shimeji]
MHFNQRNKKSRKFSLRDFWPRTLIPALLSEVGFIGGNDQRLLCLLCSSRHKPGSFPPYLRTHVQSTGFRRHNSSFSGANSSLSSLVTLPCALMMSHVHSGPHVSSLELPLIHVGERAQRCALSIQLATYLFELGNTHAPGSAGLPFLRAVFDIGSMIIHPSCPKTVAVASRRHQPHRHLDSARELRCLACQEVERVEAQGSLQEKQSSEWVIWRRSPPTLGNGPLPHNTATTNDYLNHHYVAGPRTRGAAARKSVPKAPAPPAPSHTSSSRVRTLTEKQQQNVEQHAAKASAAEQWAQTKILRARQAEEEEFGFRRVNSDIESEDEYGTSGTAFTSMTVTPTVKTIVRNGRTLVRRVPSFNENSPPQGSFVAPPRNRNLIRRVSGPASRGPPHFMMDPGQHLEGQLQAPTHYEYSDAHPELQYSPHSLTPPQPNKPSSLANVLHTENHPRPSITTAPSTIDSPPSGHVKTGTVRKAHPLTVSPSATVITKKIKSEGGADFDQLSKTILEVAISAYRARIATEEPYPERLVDRDWAADTWIEACHAQGVQIEFDEDIERLITSRSSQCRGQLKTNCRALMPLLYGLDSDIGKRENRDNVEDLLNRSAFLYKDPKKRTGFLLHPIIPTVINKTWFKNKNDEGIVHSCFSEGGIPLVTIALVATAVECCLDEWQSGEHVDVPFSAAQYQAKYNAHMTTLVNFEAKTKEANIIPRLRQHLLKKAMKHAKVDETASSTQTVELADADIEAAKKEWEAINLSDDEDGN